MHLAVAAALAGTLSFAASALAAPTTVNLRVEGSTATLFEGPVSGEVPAPPGFATPSSKGPHLCDFKDNGTHEGFGPNALTPTVVLYDAAAASGFAFDAEWSTSLNDFFITKFGPNASNETEFWGYAVNYSTAEVGGCQFALANGSEVLWAFNYFNLEHLLDLTGPASADVGVPFAVHVADGRTGEAIAGAAIGEDVAGTTTSLPGEPKTNANGDAMITLSHSGTIRLKATAAHSVRSEGLVVCVHKGNDGTCGTSAEPPAAPEPPVRCLCGFPTVPLDSAVAAGVSNGHLYGRRHAPRLLGGSVTVPVGASLKQVRISLARQVGRRCYVFDGFKESFVRARCGTTRFFSVGSFGSFSYLLPAPLRAGRYVYDVEAVSASGGISKLVAGVSHVVFRVA